MSDERADREARLLNKIATRMYGKTYQQLKAAGYIWAKCVESVEAEAASRKLLTSMEHHIFSAVVTNKRFQNLRKILSSNQGSSPIFLDRRPAKPVFSAEYFPRQNTIWILFQDSNGDTGSKRYCFWFESRAIARSYKKHIESLSGSCGLKGPVRFRRF